MKKPRTMNDMKENNAFLVMMLSKTEAKKGLKEAKQIFGKATWVNLTFVSIAHSLWVETSQEAAIKGCRENNRESRNNTYFYIKLPLY